MLRDIIMTLPVDKTSGYLCNVLKLLQQAVQEKFRQAGENLDNLNAWLDQVEREIASQEGISEDPESLKSQINAIKVNITLILVYPKYNILEPSGLFKIFLEFSGKF